MRVHSFPLSFFVYFLSSFLPLQATELPRLEGVIAFDECSHHSPQKELIVGQTVLGVEGIQIKTVTHYGTCVAYEVYDPQAQAVFELSPTGPNCSISSLEESVSVLRTGEEGYPRVLEALAATVQRLYEGYACSVAHPELEGLLRYLEDLPQK